MENSYHTLDAKVSVFAAANNPNPIRTNTIREILESINDPKHFKDKIINLRNEYKRIAKTITDKREIKEAQDKADILYKKQLTAYTFGGVFTWRENKSLKSPSGFVCVDFDDVKNIDTIKKDIEDDWVFCSFISPSGTGLKALYKIPVEHDVFVWKRRVQALLEYLNHKFRIEIANGDFKIDDLKEVSRLCFTSYDTDIYINEQSFVFEGIIDEKPKKKTDPIQLANINVNVNQQDVINTLSNMIADKFSTFESGGRYNGMVSILPRIKSACIAHQLDDDLVLSMVEKEYNKLFSASEWQNERYILINFWQKLEIDNPQPLSEFNVYQAKSPIIDVEKNVFDISLGIFDSQKAAKIPPEEELKLMTVDINDKRFDSIKTETLLNVGNFFGVVATGSSGKTSVVNSILAQILSTNEKRKNVKNIHFNITENVKRCLVFDSELDFYNYPKFYEQLLYRIGLSNTHDNIKCLMDSELVDYFSMSEWAIATNETEPMNPLLTLIERAYNEGNPYSLIILDDITIFTPDVNDSKQVVERYLELKRLAKKYGFGIFATIHANSGDHVGKARGHSGSELERKAETVLHIIRENDTGLFKITLGVGNKNRNGALTFLMHDNPLLAEWNDEYGCIVGIDTTKTSQILQERLEGIKPKSKFDLIKDFIENKFIEKFNNVDTILLEEVRQWVAEWYSINNERVTNETIKNRVREITTKIDVNIAQYEYNKGKAGIFNKPPKARSFEEIIKPVKVLNENEEISYFDKLKKDDERDLDILGQRTIGVDDELTDEMLDNMFGDL